MPNPFVKQKIKRRIQKKNKIRELFNKRKIEKIPKKNNTKED